MAIYYVNATDGDDAKDGLSEANAWKTIGKANSTLVAGDTVYIMNGTYNETIAPTNSGTEGNPITYAVYPGHTATLTRYVTLTGWTNYSGNVYYASFGASYYSGVWEDDYETAGYYVCYWPQSSLEDVDGPGKYYRDTTELKVYVWTKNGDDPSNHTMRMGKGKISSISDRDYLIIDGLTFKWAQKGIDWINCNHCIVRNLTIQYMAGMGIFLDGGSSYNEISNNTLWNIGGWYWDEGDGINLSDGTHHNTIEYNNISIVAHNCITSYGGSGANAPHDNIIQYNEVYDSGSSGLNCNVYPYDEIWRYNISYGHTGAGLQTDSSNNEFYYNIFYHNGYLEDAGSPGISVYSTSTTDTNNNKFYNNIIFDNKGAGIKMTNYGDGSCSNNIFKNNIIFDNQDSVYDAQIIFDGTAVMDSNVFAYNCIYRSDATKIRTYEDGVNTLTWMESNYPNNFSNNLQQNPLFVDADNGNFGLQADSPCIDAGTDVSLTSDYNGSLVPMGDGTPDIGAVEYARFDSSVQSLTVSLPAPTISATKVLGMGIGLDMGMKL